MYSCCERLPGASIGIAEEMKAISPLALLYFSRLEPRPITVGANKPSPFSPWHLAQYFEKTFLPASASCLAFGVAAVGAGVGEGIDVRVGVGVAVGVAVGGDGGVDVGAGAAIVTGVGMGVGVGEAQAATNAIKVKETTSKIM